MRGRPLRDGLGLPTVTGRRPVLVAMVIDTLGTGLFLPFAVVYFLRTTPIPLLSVGIGLSAANAMAVALTPVLGLVVDRFGATACVVVAGLLQAAGYTGYLAVHTRWQLMIFTLLAAAGRRLFWTAYGAFVALVTDPGESARWFGLLQALRSSGYALGGVLAAVAVAAGTPAAFRLLVLGNAASFALAALLVTAWASRRARTAHADRPVDERAASAAPPSRGGWLGYRQPLTDRPFLLLLLSSFWAVLCQVVLDVLLTVEVTGPLHRPAWVASLLFTLNGVLIVTAQTSLTRWTEHQDRTRVLQLAAVLWAATFLIVAPLAAAPPVTVLPALIIALLMFTVAEMLSTPVGNDLVLTLAPTHQQGRYFAISGLTWSLPQAIAPAAFTWLFSQGPHWPWLALVGGCGISAAALHGLRRMLPARVNRPEPPSDSQP